MSPGRTAYPYEFGSTIAQAGPAPFPRADEAAVAREAVIAMLERERRSFTSSLIALALLAVGIAALPSAGLMLCLLLLRAASFIFTRGAASALERCIRAGQPLDTARRRLWAGMVVTGMTLALLLWPQPASAPPFAVALIQVVVLVAVTLISVTLAALPGPRDAMLASFLATVSALILIHPAVSDGLVVVFAAMVVGVRIYSHNTGRHIVSAAAMLVENRSLSEELAEALAHAEFLSWRDPLTGLYNRRKLFETNRREGQTARRQLLMIDLDRFKLVNDRFGHGAGDHVLIRAAEVIRDWCREHAGQQDPLAFRLGGEEFLVVLEACSSDEAVRMAEHLRTAIERVASALPAYPGIVVTASLGIAEWLPHEGLDDALARADLACYAAKNSGRNRINRAA